ncbi:MAG: hypothetical protein E7324_04785 [Clostridiales bacterium]|nr:hypothetical protein [Clostridiales bacterium]
MKRFLWLMMALMLGLAAFSAVQAEEEENMGTYRTENYTLDGLRNPDGSLVRGVNFTPVHNGGWFVGAMARSDYRPDLMRRELAMIKQMGFNSVRILSPFGDWLFGNKTACRAILDNYDDFFRACREFGLTADVVLPRFPQEDYSDQLSFTRWLLKEMVTRFEEKYSDVIIMWEVANEPDLNVFTTDAIRGIRAYENSEEWNQVMRPCLQFTRDYLKELEVETPLSVGAMTSSLYTSWDAENFDVINLHPYIALLEVADQGYTRQAAAMDMETLGYVRPMVFTEVSWASGNLSRASDIMQYCEENNIAYYLWGWGANSYEQCMQGIMDPAGRLRVATLPFSLLQRHEKWWPAAAASYDDTPAGGGADIRGILSEAMFDSRNPAKMATAAQNAHGQLGALAGYWTPDFRECYLTAPGESMLEKSRYVLEKSLLSMLPYIRTYGTYANDNALGGGLPANYFENHYKYNTSRGHLFFRSRFAEGEGKRGTDGIVMCNENELVLRQPLNPAQTYQVSVDLRPGLNTVCGVGLACGDDEDTAYQVKNPGVYFRVSHLESADSARNMSSTVQKALAVEVRSVNQFKAESWLKTLNLTEDMFDEDGYVHFSIRFSGNGTLAYPLQAEVFAGGVSLGKIIVKSGTMQGDGNIVLFNSGCDYSYFDNLLLEDAQGHPLLSDTFESGKYDYELLTYTNERGRRDWASEAARDGLTNQKYFDAIYKNAVRLLGQDILHAQPEKFALYRCDSLLCAQWEYAGTGESGFEIQRSLDGKTWHTYWRTMAGSRSAVIPLFAGEAEKEYLYRISPVTAQNDTPCFTAAISAGPGHGQTEEYLASYTDPDGRRQTVEIVGNAPLRSADLNPIPRDKKQPWVSRYNEKTESKTDIVNLPWHP